MPDDSSSALLQVARVGGGGGAQLLRASRPRDGVQMVRLLGESVDVLVLGPARTCSKHHAGAPGQGESRCLLVRTEAYISLSLSQAVAM